MPDSDKHSNEVPGAESEADTSAGIASSGIAVVAREVEEFVAAGGWDQAIQLFALVPTAALLAEQPELARQLDAQAPLTPVAQEALPEGDLAGALAQIAWPEAVHGCALAQEIVVLPPDAEAELPDGTGPSDNERLRDVAANHPMRTEARLVVAVLREGAAACVLRLRGEQSQATEHDPGDEIVERPDLAPNLVEALAATLRP